MENENFVFDEKDIHNTSVAKLATGEIINIKQVPYSKKERKTYWCLWCDKELISAKHKEKRQDYFRHKAHNVKISERCYLAGETKRHLHAIATIMRTKEVHLPTIFKFSQDDNEKPMLLQDKKVVKAHKVLKEVTFYENEIGELAWGKRLDGKNMQYIIRPDLAFFDENDTPFLFVEIRASHKSDEEKKAKLRQHKIDTIEITIPDIPLEEIDKILKTSSYSIWLYSNLNESTKYIPTPSENGEALSRYNELQKELFEETPECKAAEISNLIRSIELYLQSEPYNKALSNIEGETNRIRNIIRERRRKWDQLRTEINQRILEQEREQTAQLKQEENSVEFEQKDLERRYHFKKQRIINVIQSIQDRTSELYRKQGIIDTNRDEEVDETKRIERDIRIDIQRERAKVEEIAELIEFEEQGIEQIRADQARERDSIGELRSEVNERVHSIEQGIRESIDRTKRDIEKEPERIEFVRKKIEEEIDSSIEEANIEIERIERDKREEPKRFTKHKQQLERSNRENLDEQIQRVDKAFESRDFSGTSELSKRVDQLFERRKLILDIAQDTESFSRIKEALKSFRNGTYKEWYKP